MGFLLGYGSLHQTLRFPLCQMVILWSNTSLFTSTMALTLQIPHLSIIGSCQPLPNVFT